MLSDQEVTAVYLGFVPPAEYTLYLNSTPADGVPIVISIDDNNGENNGNTSFSRLYNEGKEVTATAPDTFNGLDFREWLLNGRPLSSQTSVTVTMLSDMTLTAAEVPSATGVRMLPAPANAPQTRH